MLAIRLIVHKFYLASESAKMRNFFGAYLMLSVLSDQCPDDELSHQCARECYSLVQACQDQCGQLMDYHCMSECDFELEECIQFCPCHTGCPDGCSGCNTPFCQCNDKTANPDYNNCIEQLDEVYIKCVIDCNYDSTCLSGCLRDHDENITYCPCNENCPNGCPCQNYECTYSTTTQPATTSAVDKPKTSVLILNTAYRESARMVINGQGRATTNFNFVY